MDAHISLQDNFSSMQDEFNSSNNRSLREINDVFNDEFKDLEESLDYFNGEYLVIDKRKLRDIIDNLKENIANLKVAHEDRCKRSFDKESLHLKQSLCNFFGQKLLKGDNSKKTICSEVKKIFDKMCDFNFIGFEEELDTEIYNFKVNFESEYIRDEYCKDDFNKIIRSFEHSLFDHLRSKLAVSIVEKQEIFSRHVYKAYDIIGAYKEENNIKLNRAA